MRIGFYIFISLILCQSFLKSQAQSNPYQHFSLPEGLPSSESYDVYQDTQGFIWFATDNGVVRYDGKNMELFQTNEGLSDPVVFEFIEDSKQRLWFRTFSGKISYFFNEKIYPYQHANTLYAHCKSSFLESLYIDTKDQVWFGTAFEIGRIDTDGKAIIEDRNNSKYQISLRNVENELISSHEGLKTDHIIVNGKKTNAQWADTLFHRAIMRTVKWQGHRYFSWGTAIYKVEDNLITPVLVGKEQIISLYVDSTDRLWIGFMHGGVECYSDLGIKNLNSFDFLKSKSVTKILQDRNGGFWFSTLEDGIYYVPYVDFWVQELPPDLKITKAISWQKKIIVGDINGELNILSKNGNIKPLKKLEHNIHSMLISSTNKLWVSSGGGTYLFDTLFNTKNKTFRSFSDLHEAKDGTIWGVNGPKRLQYDQEGQFIKFYESNKTNRSIYTNENFAFLFGRLGLQVFTLDNREIKLPPFFEALKATKILPLNDSLLLFGTLGNGFLIVNQNGWTYHQYSSKHKFMVNNVYDVMKEGPSVWMGTEKGIALASVKSIIQGSPDFSFFITKNESGNNKINHLITLRENVIAFSEHFFYSFPKKINTPALPLFRVQSLLVNNQPDSMRADHRLASDKNNIQINFRFIDYRNQNILIRSRLSPSDQWSYSTERNIKFYSLRSDSYHLELEYSVDNIHWHKATSWDFTVLPPWWRTWYFETSFILFILSWGAIYLKRRDARVNERNKLINTQQQRLIRAELETLESERNRIAKDLHDSIGTNLSAIKMTVRSILKKYNDPKAEAVENEFQNTIQDIKGIIHDLVPAGLDKYGLSETIRSHAAKIEENLNLKIEVNSFGPDSKDPRINLLSFRILQELLSNTLKHAQASKVMIHINSFDDLLSILYEDNGKGFDVETVAKGSGLYNIQSRVQTANGTLKFESGNFGVSYIIDIPLNSNGQ